MKIEFGTRTRHKTLKKEHQKPSSLPSPPFSVYLQQRVAFLLFAVSSFALLLLSALSPVQSLPCNQNEDTKALVKTHDQKDTVLAA